MKNFALYLLLIITISFKLISAEYELTPIDVDYKGIEVKGDTVIVYGSYGTILLSYDNAKNRQQIQAFDKGTIMKIFWDDHKIVAFTDEGGISVSVDKAKSWKKVHQLNDSVFAIVKYPKGYFIRSGKKLYTIDDDYELKDSFRLQTVRYWAGLWYYPKYTFQYKYSIASYKNLLIAEIDSSNILIFDTDLNLADTVSFSKLGTCYECYSGFQLRSDSLCFYLVVENRIYKTLDFINWEKVYNCSDSFILFQPSNNEVHILDFIIKEYSSDPYKIIFSKILNKNSAEKMTEFDSKEMSSVPQIVDFKYENNILYIVGDYKFITTVNCKDSIIDFVSNSSYAKFSLMPEQLGDSTYLIYSGFSNPIYNPEIFFTDDNYLTIKPLVKYINNKLYLGFSDFNIKYFDKETKTIYFGGKSKDDSKSGILISEDFGTSFNFKPIKYYNFNGIITMSTNYRKLRQYQNFQVLKDTYVTPSNVYYNGYYAKILTYDKNFELVSQYVRNGYAYDYVYAKDTNTFLTHGWDSTCNCFEIKYTTNKGADWEMIKKYRESDSMFYYKELDFNGRKYMIMSNYNPLDSIYTIEAVDVEAREMVNIYQYKELIQDKFIRNHNAYESDRDTFYLSISDTLFYFTDFKNKDNWKYYILPAGGNIQRFFKKFGNQFYANYKDDKHTLGVYWLKILPDTTLPVVEETKTEQQTYLYIHAPCPVPAKNSVRSLIYWDPRIDIDDDVIGVIDVSGNKIEGKENITIDKLTPYSGFLTWNCAGVAPGIYFIHIKHGNNSRIMKVVISR